MDCCDYQGRPWRRAAGLIGLAALALGTASPTPAPAAPGGSPAPGPVPPNTALACGTVPLDWNGARRLLLVRGPALRLSRDRVTAARADLVTAGERPNPTLSFGAAHYIPRNGVGPGSLADKPLDSVLRVDQTLERGNKRELRQAQARRGVEAAELQAADDRRTQTLALFNAYADLRLAEVMRVGAQDQLDALNESFEMARQRADAGRLPPGDLLRHRIETARATAEASRAEDAVAAARVAIIALLGCPRSAVEVSSHGLALPVDDAPPAEVADADVEGRPDVQAADARTRAAEVEVELNRASLARDVDVGVQFENDPGPDGTGRSLGFGIAVPLFLAHRYEGEIARAEADRLAAEDTAAAARIEAEGEMVGARTQLVSALERAGRARTGLLPDAIEAGRQAEDAYRRGELDFGALLDARRTLRAVRVEVDIAENEALRARAAWNAARGRGLLGGRVPDTVPVVEGRVDPPDPRAPGPQSTSSPSSLPSQ